MALHLIKLCVGIETVEDLEESLKRRLWQQKRLGMREFPFHTTRMVPKRAEEVLKGGSLYWVIKGNVQCRQKFKAIEPFKGDDGIGRCDLVLEPEIIRTHFQPKRPFQGWRYFKDSDVPLDLITGEDGEEVLPMDLQAQLAELGLR